MNIVKEVLLQHFISLMPFVIYNFYYRDKMQNYDRNFILITCAICLFLSMTFAAGVMPGVYYDGRYVMIFFGLLFGGIQTGLTLLLEFVLYRLYIGGEGLVTAFMAMAAAFPLSVLLCWIYQRTRRKSLIIFSSGFIISSIPMIVIYLHPKEFGAMNAVNAVQLFSIPFQNAVSIWALLALFQRAVSDKELFMAYAQNDKAEAVSHVAASLVHEVRNPLTAVKGFLKLMREHMDDHRRIEGYIDICTDEIQRTEHILSEYLAISKPKIEKREALDLAVQVEGILEIMRPYANMNNVELLLEKTPRKVVVLANQDKIKQILMNFIKNAIEACSNVAYGQVSLRLDVSAGKALLTIRDNGIGMNKEQMERLGSIYFSTKTRGTGLGLTFSYQAIRELGGSVSVRSAPKAGTQFTIKLPAFRG
jgi:two-component system sporulation sensor kinase B